MNKKIKKIIFPLQVDKELLVLLEKKWWHRFLCIIYYLLLFVYFLAIGYCLLSIPFVVFEDQGIFIFTILSYLLLCIVIPYFCLIILQFLYFNVFLYIIYGKKENVKYNLKKILKILIISILTIFIVGGIILLVASDYCGNSSKFNTSSLNIECKCGYGYVSSREGCIKLVPNAHECLNSRGWCCDEGYHILLEKCVKD
ncbi:MAG: hypothetical protein PHU32_04075 [Candidatus ainarchaeum sp.]|nr:hypothetical protein [Candidatus ainarchaeum sp.]